VVSERVSEYKWYIHLCVIDPTLAREMAMYKGVELFGEFADDASTGKFPQWQIKVRIALKKNFPESVKFISRSSQELQAELGRAVSAVSSAEAAQQLRLEHEEAQLDAAGHLLLFLAEPLSSQVHRFRKGSELWAYLAEQHEVWLHSRGVVLQREQRMLGPRESECVAAYCRRAFQLQEDLANANRVVSDVAMVEAVLDGLERERPEWRWLCKDCKPG
jgi:hypothetical protein